jgi:hypothetical protein
MLDAAPQAITPQAGLIEFSVSGHAISNLHIPLTSPRPAPVQFNIEHLASGSAPAPQGRGRSVLITVSHAGGMFADGSENSLAMGNSPGQLDSSYVQPGEYWVQTRFDDKSLCEDSFIAGAANLAREPLVLGLSGASAPLQLTARDDCGKLTLTMPSTPGVLSAGEEQSWTVYVVPDFDSTTEIEPATLRPSSGPSVTLEGLTPGNYHVFTFGRPVMLEYRSREAIAALATGGQQISVSPGAAANLVLEAPGH